MADQEQGGEGEGGGPERAALEAEAATMGWASRDKWRGDPAAWVDADEFVERGRVVVPMMRKNNERLVGEVTALKQQAAKAEQAAAEAAKAVEALISNQAEIAKVQVQERLKELRSQRREAVKAGDHDLAADLDELIDAQKDKLAEPPPKAKPAAAPAAAPAAPQIEAWAQEFGDANPWLQTDRRKAGLFLGICDELKSTTSLREGALLAEAKKQMDEILGGVPRGGKSEEGSGGGFNGSGGGGNGGVSGYAKLPAEAKAQCDRDEHRFVGEGKPFKDQKAWREHYVAAFNE